MKKGIRQLVTEAEAEIETLTVEQARALAADPRVTFVDLRDVRELEREGAIPGAFHAPRGMLEFWVDPESPYFKPVFATGNKFVFFCAGGLRSALATQQVQRMGLEPVAHIAGGFGAWKKAGGPVQPYEKPKPAKGG
ncbi:MAG: rhodanese-like domain-containing protein [Deltaproteobacteria bacterium]|nr:rhodanese-like domain-containing protein [Deltaproteobacteria bacterium]